MNRNFVAFVALTGLVALPGITSYAQDQTPLPATAGIGADDVYNTGVDLQMAKKYKEAITKYTEAIAKRKTFSDAYLNRGICYSEIEDFEKALADFAFYIRRKPDVSEGYLARAGVYSKQKQYQRALDEIKVGEKKNRSRYQNLIIYYARGSVYQDMGDYDKAIAEYSEHIAQSTALKMPVIPPIYQSRGNAYMMRYRALEKIGATAESQKAYEAAQRDFAEYAKTNSSPSPNV